MEITEQNVSFDQKKTEYFYRLGLKVRQAIKKHQTSGLLDKQKRDWRNVSEHCLVVAARAQVMGQWVGLSEEVISKMLVGAALHDFSKKQEIEMAKRATAQNTSAWDAFEQVTHQAVKQLQDEGFDNEVIWLAQAAPYGSIKQTDEILRKENISELETAFLIIHYSDDISQGTEWVSPMLEESDGTIVNQLDRRLRLGENNPKYAKLNEEGRNYFQGETTFQTALRAGHQIEERLTALIEAREHVSFDSKQLPERIDNTLRERINLH